jgi:hypothetical protein
MPTLSLCLTVRNEGAMLASFLSAARGLYDELVAVDTGSTDETLALLHDHGARIVAHPWSGDFSAARNAGLEAASGDFILVLDPDEQISPEFVAEVREKIADPELGAAKVTMRHTLPYGHLYESQLLRLFRREASARYRFRIHEDISSDVQAYLDRSGRRLGVIEAPVLHLGAERDICDARGKKTRDTELLWACLDDDADDLYSWHKLLEQGRFHRDEVLCARAAEGAWAALARVGQVQAHGHFIAELVANILWACSPQTPRRCQALLHHWLEQMPDSPALLIALGERAEAQGELEAAQRSFAHCLTLEGRAPNRQLTGVRPRMGLARLALQLGDLEAAARHTAASLQLAPEDPEAQLAWGALVQAGVAPGQHGVQA